MINETLLEQWQNTKIENDKLQQENQQLERALTDIKEYIERCGFKYLPYYLNEDATENLLDMVNKALGGDNNENIKRIN